MVRFEKLELTSEVGKRVFDIDNKLPYIIGFFLVGPKRVSTMVNTKISVRHRYPILDMFSSVFFSTFEFSLQPWLPVLERNFGFLEVEWNFQPSTNNQLYVVFSDRKELGRPWRYFGKTIATTETGLYKEKVAISKNQLPVKNIMFDSYGTYDSISLIAADSEILTDFSYQGELPYIYNLEFNSEYLEVYLNTQATGIKILEFGFIYEHKLD